MAERQFFMDAVDAFEFCGFLFDQFDAHFFPNYVKNMKSGNISIKDLEKIKADLHNQCGPKYHVGSDLWQKYPLRYSEVTRKRDNQNVTFVVSRDGGPVFELRFGNLLEGTKVIPGNWSYYPWYYVPDDLHTQKNPDDRCRTFDVPQSMLDADKIVKKYFMENSFRTYRLGNDKSGPRAFKHCAEMVSKGIYKLAQGEWEFYLKSKGKKTKTKIT